MHVISDMYLKLHTPRLSSGGSRIDERGFQYHRILAMGVLTMENGAVARKANHLGGSGGMPPRRILNFRLRSFLVQSGSNRDRYTLGIYLNTDS